MLSVSTDVRLTAPSSEAVPGIPQTATLRFLHIVETARVPLYMTLGAPCKVTTSNDETERWLSQIIASGAGEEGAAWWESARLDSPLGVLVGVEYDALLSGNAKGPQVTELLLYASQSQSGRGRLPTPPPSSPGDHASFGKEVPILSVHAIPLSSGLLQAAESIEPTPPASPLSRDEDIDAAFLPQSFPVNEEIINEPPVRKRRSAADAFDEASERRRKARRRGGEGVIAAAAPKTESQLQSLKHRRSVSITQPVPLQTRPLSRSPSVASSRPTTAMAQAAKKSSLSQVQNTVEPNGMEVKNKDFVSRIVMAGMRLYGLSQSKPHSKHKATSAAPSPAIDISFEERDAERKNDEEFKLVYHQTYKGTCFALRQSMGGQTLQPFAEQVRETVDKLLAIFCNDPLAQGLQGCAVDEVTPGGRKAFGSKTAQNERRPFSPLPGSAAEAHTPSWRQKGKDG